MAHTYRTSLAWAGSTGAGYDVYDRTHSVTPAGAPALSLTADPTFRGAADLANPEQLLLAAASSCQLLSFLAVAARSGVDVVDYADEATAMMPDDVHPVRITEIVLRPRIAVRGNTSRVERLVRKAHEGCYIANSLAVAMRIETEVVSVP